MRSHETVIARINHLCLFIVFGFVAILLAGCVPVQTRPVVENYVPKFDFQPPSASKPGSTGIALALVDTHYGAQSIGAWQQVRPFADFTNSMSKDFEEILTNKGFGIKGPFRNYDEMTFPDKKGCQLILEPTLELSVNNMNLSSQLDFAADIFAGPNVHVVKLSGVTALGGRISLILRESLTNEKMWIKSVELPAKQVTWTTQESYQIPRAGGYPLEQLVNWADPGLANPIGKALEEYYQEIMEASWKYLNPEEVQLVNRQAQEIRKKKVY
ncbi:hypothetical protein CO110_10205 [Candidatus Desantisbacteria bacterium CG_4_9_14_3_um_filter_40_11]|uniref:Uncharacterized protein n=1 Tax=Candidatus Desantisbacteria bacterium CG_4_9_14_3_um_filter_40_11 TaxID=1974546 RepID=A0A2M8AR80_9BACT|nr:MAG: hypothetical protein CO110_10205 [Candidatus Desantisbacteria bacterium CG_4_9_14_3_um_filter_40_11]